MLIGAYCARDRNITVNAFDEAKRRLQNFGFVGLTDNYNASVCLLCRMYGVVPRPFMFGTDTNGIGFWKNLEIIDGDHQRFLHEAPLYF